MPRWITKVHTLQDGKLIEYFGDYIDATTQEEAIEITQTTGRGYLKVTDQMLVEEINE
jgi:hypothetical protein